MDELDRSLPFVDANKPTPVHKPLIASAAAVFVCFTGIFTVPTSGQHPPTLSDDLLAHPARAHGHRVIVQADDLTLNGLRGRGLGALRRTISGGVALEVTDQQLDALMRNPGIEIGRAR